MGVQGRVTHHGVGKHEQARPSPYGSGDLFL